MSDQLFRGIFDTAFTTVISPLNFLLCLGVSLAAGLLLSLMVQWKSRQTESFAVTIALLPAAVSVVIMMVNGNIGAGVAVAGAFSLVRFRSNSGSGREIIAIFIAMGAGLLIGMGYLAYALLFTAVLGGMMMLYSSIRLGASRRDALQRQLRITIPESLNYSGVFDPVLKKYTVQYSLRQVRSTNMGSMFKLVYELTLRDGISEKELLDDLRCLNGNLEISLSYPETPELPSL